MQRSTANLLADASEAGRAAVELLDGRSAAALQQSRVRRAAVERELITLGEALAQLRRVRPSAVANISLQDAIRLRNRLVHEYYRMHPALVWDAVTRLIPAALSELDRLSQPDSPLL